MSFYRYVIKLLILVLFISAACFDYALAFDINDYKPTLDNASLGMNSGYSVVFSEVSSGTKISYYTYDTNADLMNPVTLTYNKYTYTLSSVSTSGETVYNTGQQISSELNNLNAHFAGTNSSGALYVTGDGGNALAAKGKIDSLVGDFYNNRGYYYAGGGAAILNNGIINSITGDFVGNTAYTSGGGTVYGGAIYNGSTASGLNAENYIGSINGNFLYNLVYSRNGSEVRGGAIASWRNIGSIVGSFLGNIAYNQYDYVSSAFGGAIFTGSGLINEISADFIYNGVLMNATGAGGGIANFASINKVTGEFNTNYVYSTSGQAFGGGIFNQGYVGDVESNFIRNYVSGHAAYGGAIANGNLVNEIIFEVNVSDWDDANEKYPVPSTPGSGSSGSHPIEITSIVGNFVGNYAIGGSTIGGAIYNSAYIGSIIGDFAQNFVEGTGVVQGGAIANVKSDANVGEIDLISGSFYNNNATNKSTGLALGGAIYTYSSLNFAADGADSIFHGNFTNDFRGKSYNAIFVDTTISPVLTFDMKNDGSYLFSDSILGGTVSGNIISYTNQYSINITGDSQNKFVMKNDIINAGDVNVTNAVLMFREGDYGKGAFKPNADNAGNPVTNLNLNNATFDIANGYLETVNLAKYTASNGSFLHLDVNPDTMKADVLKINGNVEGSTQLVVYATSSKDITNLGGILFADSENDTTGGASSFSVFRVYTSPYLYDVLYIENSATDKEWHLVMNGADNPDYVPSGPNPAPNTPTVVPEVISYIGLPIAALEHTRSLVSNIGRKIANSHIFDDSCCKVFDEAHWFKPVYNAWVAPLYQNSKIRGNVEIDAKVYGMDAGIDRQINDNHKLGVFASYRVGEYEQSGKTKWYNSNKSSKIDIDSYLGGLYYRYDKNRTWVFATLYGGIQEADFSASSVNADASGTQLGWSLEIGELLPFRADTSYTLEPSIAFRYTQVDYGNAKDDYGKTSKYELTRQMEVEAALKLEKTYLLDEGTAKIYIKPSAIRPFTSGDEVEITNLGKTKVYKDEILGRIEVGGKYSLNDKLYVYGETDYTYGRNYSAAAVTVGINYSFGGNKSKYVGRCNENGKVCR